MRLPIQYALTYPEIMPSPVKTLDLTEVGSLTFEKVNMDRFPSLRLAYEAGEAGGDMPIALNAANEVADKLLDSRIKFTQIPKLVEEVMHKFTGKSFPSLEQILEETQMHAVEPEWVEQN